MDERQFNYLQEMGIPLWIPRELPSSNGVQQTSPATRPQEGCAPPTEPTPIVEPPENRPVAQLKAAPVEGPLDWDGLQRVVSQCEECPELMGNRCHTVFGTGNPRADWLIVGEAPGVEEDRQGEPFVGSAGALLNAMLKAIGLQRSQLYITNILKCHPPHNRDPLAAEIAACSGYLQRQIELIAPKIVVAVGKVAAQTLLQSNDGIGNLRGRVHRFEYGSGAVVPLVATYHPAYLLCTPQAKAESWHDLKLALNSLGE